MASRLDRRALPACLAATALSALGWWFGSGLHPLWWLTWLAPLPVLWLAPRVRARWAALAAFAAYALGGCNQWNYLHGVIGLPLPFVLQAIGAPALVIMLAALLHRRLLSRGRAVAATPGTPPDRLAILRALFLEVASDAGFVEEVSAGGLLVRPSGGEAIATLLQRLLTDKEPKAAVYRAALLCGQQRADTGKAC